jgi:hypothetical protein
MCTIVYSVVAFHLFPLVIFFFCTKKLGSNKTYVLIASLIVFSFLADVMSLWLAYSGFNTNPISNFYQIIERMLTIFILTGVSQISFKAKKLLIVLFVLLSLYQFGYCISGRFLIQNDYVKLLSGSFLCLIALHTLFVLLSSVSMDSLKIDYNVWPIFGIFLFISSMLIPEMITNIDDTTEFPEYYHQIRIGVAIGSNIIRDSLFAFFFFQTKKMNYDTGK